MADESFEEKTLDNAIHLIISAKPLAKLNDLKKKIQEWHSNLEAQFGWLNAHPTVPEIRESFEELVKLVQAEGQILFGVKTESFPALIKEINIIVSETEYPAASRIQALHLKESLRKISWWTEQRADSLVFYHAFPGRDSPLLHGGLLDPAKRRRGFYMADNPEIAALAVETVGIFEEQKLSVMRIIISRRFEYLITAVSTVNGVYQVIKLKDYDGANKAIKKGFIRFEKL